METPTDSDDQQFNGSFPKDFGYGNNFVDDINDDKPRILLMGLILILLKIVNKLNEEISLISRTSTIWQIEYPKSSVPQNESE